MFYILKPLFLRFCAKNDVKKIIKDRLGWTSYLVLACDITKIKKLVYSLSFSKKIGACYFLSTTSWT